MMFQYRLNNTLNNTFTGSVQNSRCTKFKLHKKLSIQINRFKINFNIIYRLKVLRLKRGKNLKNKKIANLIINGSTKRRSMRHHVIHKEVMESPHFQLGHVVVTREQIRVKRGGKREWEVSMFGSSVLQTLKVEINCVNAFVVIKMPHFYDSVFGVTDNKAEVFDYSDSDYRRHVAFQHRKRAIRDVLVPELDEMVH